jgi:type VI protein secretion system component VasA
MDADRLKDGLRQVLWDSAATKRTLIEAIHEVKVDSGFVMDSGVAWRRMDVEIRLRDATCTPETWDRIGILDAFGSILHAFVQDATEIGSRSRLRVLVEPAGIALDYGASP